VADLTRHCAGNRSVLADTISWVLKHSWHWEVLQPSFSCLESLLGLENATSQLQHINASSKGGQKKLGSGVWLLPFFH